MKTAISLPDHLFRHAEKVSRKLHLSRSQLYATALAQFLAQYQEKTVTDKLNAVYDAEPTVMDAPLKNAQQRVLRRDPW